MQVHDKKKQKYTVALLPKVRYFKYSSSKQAANANDL